MAPLAYILIGVGTYLFAKELNQEGKDNEQNVSHASGTRRTHGNHYDRADESGPERNRPRSVKRRAKSKLVTGDSNELQADGHLHADKSGYDHSGEQHSASGRGETESVTDDTETDIEEGDSNENERNRDGRGRDSGDDVRSQSGSGDESASPETA